MTVRALAIQHDSRTGEMSSLIHDLSRRADSLTNDRDIYPIVADGISQVLEIDRLCIVLTRGDSDWLEPVFVRGTPIEQSIVIRRSDPLVMRCMATNHAILHNVGDGGTDTPAEHERIRRGYEQVIVSPVFIDDQDFGAIEISSTGENCFSVDDLWIVESISNTLGLLLAGSKLRRGSQERTRDDELLHELGRLTLSTREPREVLRSAAERVGRTVDCDVHIMRCEHGTWVGDEPFVREESQLHAHAMLINRIKSIRPPVQLTLRQIENSASDVASAIQDLGNLVSEIDGLLESEDIFRSVVMPFAPETGGHLILVALRSNHGDPEFSDQDRALIGHVMRYLTPALINAILHDDLARALREREAFHRMSTAIGSGKDKVARIGIACRTAQLLFSCDYVALTDWSTQPPNVRFVVGSETTVPTTLSKAGTITAVRRSGDVRIINDFPNAPPLKAGWYPLHAAEGLRASLTYRLQWSGKTFGSLILGFRKPRYFSETELRFAESIARTIVASLGPELHFTE